MIDPVKVVRAALQDAASVAGLLVTTEAMVAEKPKKRRNHAGDARRHGLLTRSIRLRKTVLSRRRVCQGCDR